MAKCCIDRSWSSSWTTWTSQKICDNYFQIYCAVCCCVELSKNVWFKFISVYVTKCIKYAKQIQDTITFFPFSGNKFWFKKWKKNRHSGKARIGFLRIFPKKTQSYNNKKSDIVYLHETFICVMLCLLMYLYIVYLFILIENVIYHINVKHFDLIQCAQQHNFLFLFFFCLYFFFYLYNHKIRRDTGCLSRNF